MIKELNQKDVCGPYERAEQAFKFHIEIQKNLIELQRETIERLEKTILDLKIDSNNNSKIQVSKVWAFPLYISPKSNN